jgi:hypothetical protein
MSTRRVVIGKRADGTYGIFVSKAGFDANNAANGNLMLNISSKVSTLLMMGKVFSSQVIPLGLSRSPITLVTTENSLTGLPGYGGSGGPCRPSPLMSLTPNGNGGYVVGSGPPGTLTVNGNGASMTISCSGPTVYAVFSKAFT